MLMHHSQRAARSFVRGLEIRLNKGGLVSFFVHVFEFILTVAKSRASIIFVL